MVCSICEQDDCRAQRCNSDIVNQTISWVKGYWLGENMPDGWSDGSVKYWARSTRIGLPFWRRVWTSLEHEYNRRAYWRIEDREHPVIKFVRPKPNSIVAFRQRIEEYQRPAELPVVPPGRPPPQSVVIEPQLLPFEPQELPLDLSREYRLLRREIDQAMTNNRIRVNRQIQANEAKKNATKNIKIMMDDEVESYYMNETCAICFNDITSNDVLAFNCKHTFCGSCAVQTIKKTNLACPTCREKITEIRFKPTTKKETFNELSSCICLL
tara:strand:+ start:132 stop:938 length:807 start_codon:yes stop_codon:yes gene_type:complete